MAKQTSATLGMKITSERSSGYFHVYARPVYIGRTPSEMQAIDRGEVVQPCASDRLTFPYRWNDSEYNGVRIDGLTVACQGNDSDADRHTYAHTVRFSDVSLELFDYCEAEAKIKALKTIQKRIDVTNKTVGAAVTYGQYVGRVALAIGATRFVFAGKRFGDQILDVESGISRIDYMIREWAQRIAEKTVAS